MARAKNEFTNVTTLSAEALGEPGQRTFRILVDSSSSSAIIWLEKEQLFQLALAIQQLQVTLPEEQGTPGPPPVDREAPALTKLDFKLSKLVLGYEEDRELFIIEAHDSEEEDEESVTIKVWASRELVKEFSEEAVRVCAAGRPLCPLCGGPIDPTGHQCPRVNGHLKATTDL